jgi:hypothetical protein
VRAPITSFRSTLVCIAVDFGPPLSRQNYSSRCNTSSSKTMRGSQRCIRCSYSKTAP